MSSSAFARAARPLSTAGITSPDCAAAAASPQAWSKAASLAFASSSRAKSNPFGSFFIAANSSTLARTVSPIAGTWACRSPQALVTSSFLAAAAFSTSRASATTASAEALAAA